MPPASVAAPAAPLPATTAPLPVPVTVAPAMAFSMPPADAPFATALSASSRLLPTLLRPTPLSPRPSSPPSPRLRRPRSRSARLPLLGSASAPRPMLTRRVAEAVVPPVVSFTEHAHLKAYERAQEVLRDLEVKLVVTPRPMA